MRLIRHGGRRVIALAALLALAVSGIAIAQAASNGPRTDRVGAVFTLERVKSNARTCQGNDGVYTEDHATYVGTSVGDPRLSGTLTIRSDSLVNQADADDGGRQDRLTTAEKKELAETVPAQPSSGNGK